MFYSLYASLSTYLRTLGTCRVRSMSKIMFVRFAKADNISIGFINLLVLSAGSAELDFLYLRVKSDTKEGRMGEMKRYLK